MRTKLLNFRGLTLTEDTAQAVDALERRLAEKKWVLRLLGPQPGTDEDNLESLIPAGREVRLTLSRDDGFSSPQAVLAALWGHAVPLGFTPFNRYPLSGHGDTAFHFYGPWRPVLDRMMAEGRGHLAWPSLCAAALTDVGRWKGDKTLERFIQAQLHRTGHNCGPVDGEIGHRTARAIESLGLVRASLAEVHEHLMQLQETAPTQTERRTGSIQLPGQKFNIGVTGGVKVTRSTSGAGLVIDGPGRIVIDVGV